MADLIPDDVEVTVLNCVVSTGHRKGYHYAVCYGGSDEEHFVFWGDFRDKFGMDWLVQLHTDNPSLPRHSEITKYMAKHGQQKAGKDNASHHKDKGMHHNDNGNDQMPDHDIHHVQQHGAINDEPNLLDAQESFEHVARTLSPCTVRPASPPAGEATADSPAHGSDLADGNPLPQTPQFHQPLSTPIPPTPNIRRVMDRGIKAVNGFLGLDTSAALPTPSGPMANLSPSPSAGKGVYGSSPFMSGALGGHIINPNSQPDGQAGPAAPGSSMFMPSGQGGPIRRPSNRPRIIANMPRTSPPGLLATVSSPASVSSPPSMPISMLPQQQQQITLGVGAAHPAGNTGMSDPNFYATPPATSSAAKPGALTNEEFRELRAHISWLGRGGDSSPSNRGRGQ